MNPKQRRNLNSVWFIVVSIAAMQLWSWSVDHLPMWASFLVLLGILAGLWATGRYLLQRRKAWEAREAKARGGA